MGSGQILTFKKGNFCLINEATPYTRKIIDVKAAVRFRQYADKRCKKILERILVRRYPAPALPQLSFLDAHQREGIEWILTRSRSYIAHAPGAGKTAQAIIASAITEGSGQVLFIVPPSLTINWSREVTKFLALMAGGRESHTVPYLSIVPVSAKKIEMRWGAHYIVCPDSMLTKPWVLEKLQQIKFKFVAVDEASRFKEPYAQRSIALFGGRTPDFTSDGLVYKTQHSVLLDGSPMPNRPIELWAPTFALAPQSIDFMSQDDFGFRYCGATQTDDGKWEFKGESNQEELKARLQKDFMHVVTEDRLNHPERMRSILTMPMTTHVPTNSVKKHILENISEEASQGSLARERKQIGISKINWAGSYVKERLERKNESILLFAWHREVCEGLAKVLAKFRPLVVMGGTKNDARERGFRDFQNGGCKLIIGNIAAMGRGHNLQRADRIIFVEYSWSNELNTQCEKRASRRGRDKNLPVRCEYLEAPNTLDAQVLRSILRKANTVRRVIG